MSGRIKRPDTSKKFSLPRIGKVRCGVKKNGLPRSIDYFVAGGKYASLFNKAFPGKPDKIEVMFLDDDPARSCREEYTYRDDSGRLWARGDGYAFEIWNPKTEKYETVESDTVMEAMERRVPNKKGWEITLTLQFIVPRINGVAGVWEFSTKGSESSIPNIIEAFDTVKQIKGTVIGSVFDLTVEFAKSNKPGISSRYPVVNLVMNNSEESINMIKKSFVQQDAPIMIGNKNDDGPR